MLYSRLLLGIWKLTWGGPLLCPLDEVQALLPAKLHFDSTWGSLSVYELNHAHTAV